MRLRLFSSFIAGLFKLSFFLFIGGAFAQQSPVSKVLDTARVVELKNYTKWSYNYATQKQFDSAHKYAQKAKLLSESMANEDLIALSNIGRAYVLFYEVKVDSAKHLLQFNASNPRLHDSIQIEVARALNEIAMYQKDYRGGIPHIVRMEELLRKNGIHSYMDSIKLSNTYLSMAFLHKQLENFPTAHSYYDKALGLNPDGSIDSFIYFYKAELYSEEKELRKAIDVTKRAIAMEVDGKNRKLFIPTYELALSTYYLQLEKGDSAIYHGKKGLVGNEECQLDLLHEAIGDGYMLQNNYVNAINYYEQALEESVSPISEVNFHEKLRNSYTRLGDYKKALVHNGIYLRLRDSIEQLKVKQEVLTITKKFESSQKELEIERLQRKDIENAAVIKTQKNRLRFISFGLLSTLVIAGLLLYFYTLQKQQRKLLFKKNVQLAQELKQNNVKIHVSKARADHQEINDAQRSAILTKLDVLIASEFYLDTEMSLSKLAKLLETNTSYLSKIINEDYQKTFATFINELRLSYTLKRMESQPAFRKLTIEHIAEKSGFASSSTFYSAFKKFTGLTPSYYIKQRVLQPA